MTFCVRTLHRWKKYRTSRLPWIALHIVRAFFRRIYCNAQVPVILTYVFQHSLTSKCVTDEGLEKVAESLEENQRLQKLR